MTNCPTGRQNAAYIAGRLLMVWRTGPTADFQKQLEQTRAMMHRPSNDAGEMEKLEALQGALDCLESLPHARVGAAIRLLEHLARGKY
ncbi:MAG TPA: hypothetical protein VLX11_10175 [Candidatus Acidoferrales bacterium]|nr:hypothetical protein [Candidatus Acidoferrales bacterium]